MPRVINQWPNQYMVRDWICQFFGAVIWPWPSEQVAPQGRFHRSHGHSGWCEPLEPLFARRSSDQDWLGNVKLGVFLWSTALNTAWFVNAGPTVFEWFRTLLNCSMGSAVTLFFFNEPDPFEIAMWCILFPCQVCLNVFVRSFWCVHQAWYFPVAKGNHKFGESFNDPTPTRIGDVFNSTQRRVDTALLRPYCSVA